MKSRCPRILAAIGALVLCCASGGSYLSTYPEHCSVTTREHRLPMDRLFLGYATFDGAIDELWAEAEGEGNPGANRQHGLPSILEGESGGVFLAEAEAIIHHLRHSGPWVESVVLTAPVTPFTSSSIAPGQISEACLHSADLPAIEHAALAVGVHGPSAKMLISRFADGGMEPPAVREDDSRETFLAVDSAR